MKDNSPKRFRETMTYGQVTRWLNFIKTRSMAFQTVKGMEEDLKEFLEAWNKVSKYDGPKKEKSGQAWNQTYWTTLVNLDFMYISLEEKYRKIIKENSK